MFFPSQTTGSSSLAWALRVPHSVKTPSSDCAGKPTWSSPTTTQWVTWPGIWLILCFPARSACAPWFLVGFLTAWGHRWVNLTHSSKLWAACIFTAIVGKETLRLLRLNNFVFNNVEMFSLLAVDASVWSAAEEKDFRDLLQRNSQE